jgi:hypothetical protein
MITTESSEPHQSSIAFDPLTEPLIGAADRSSARPTAYRKRTRPFPRRQTAAISRHARKCSVCRHRDRADIDADFLHWHSAENIAAENNLDAAAIYRHAHATGLFNERMRNVRYAAIHIAEKAESVKPTASAVLQAIRACTLIDGEGKWNDPPKRVIIEHHHVTVSQAESVSQPESKNTPKTESSNRNFSQLENAATPTKQTEAPSSNRNFRSTKNEPASPSSHATNSALSSDQPAP